MANSIGRIFGGGNGYGIYYNNQKKPETETPETKQSVVTQQEEQQIDPNEVLNILANTASITGANNVSGTFELKELDPDTLNRIAGYMERFELVAKVATDEFGDSGLALVDMML